MKYRALVPFRWLNPEAGKHVFYRRGEEFEVAGKDVPPHCVFLEDGLGRKAGDRTPNGPAKRTAKPAAPVDPLGT